MARQIDEFVHRVREETANTLKAYFKNPELFIDVRDGKPVFRGIEQREVLRRAADFLIGANEIEKQEVGEERGTPVAVGRVVFDPAKIVDASLYAPPRGRPRKCVAEAKDLLRTIRNQTISIERLRRKTDRLEAQLASIRAIAAAPRKRIKRGDDKQ